MSRILPFSKSLLTHPFFFLWQVYLLSAEARCDKLAISMMESFLFDGSFTPPSLPPLETVLVPPPPPPPPSPPVPRIPREESDRVVYVEPSVVRLSTYFLGESETDPTTASTALGNQMALSNVANATRAAALQTITSESLPISAWAACSTASAAAPLPCRTGDTPSRCLDGARHCGSTEDNTEAPFLEIDLLSEWPDDRPYYFFGLEILLPRASELATLFFSSSQGGTDDRFYTVTVYDETHNPLATQCKPYYEQSLDHYTDGLVHFQFVCLEALAEDSAYEAMTHVRFVRLTLTGSYRMIWLEGLTVVLRTTVDLEPSPPPSPGLPPSPPSPLAPPDPPPDLRSCAFHNQLVFDPTVVALTEAFVEPCGLSPAECCALAYDHSDTFVFQLSAAGCCTLFSTDSIPTALPSLATGFGSSMTGVRNS